MNYLQQINKKILKEIPIFFAVDDNYAPLLCVALKSIKQNSSRNYYYSIFVLTAGLKQKTKDILKGMEDENYEITFVDVQKELSRLGNMLHTRDYYTKSTYYRLFIQKLFPQYDKALYLDSDIIVLEDISKLYTTDLKSNLVGAIVEDVMVNVDVFGNYVENCLDISRHKFFNAGVLIMNLKLFREENVEEQFLSLISRFKFTVTQDEDYLNVICKDRVIYLDLGWNKSPMEDNKFNDKDLKIVHYKMAYKPWHYDNIKYGEYFWQYANCTQFKNVLLTIKNNYSIDKQESDKVSYNKLVDLAISEANKIDNYKNVISRRKSNLLNNIKDIKICQLLKKTNLG